MGPLGSVLKDRPWPTRVVGQRGRSLRRFSRDAWTYRGGSNRAKTRQDSLLCLHPRSLTVPLPRTRVAHDPRRRGAVVVRARASCMRFPPHLLDAVVPSDVSAARCRPASKSPHSHTARPLSQSRVDGTTAQSPCGARGAPLGGAHLKEQHAVSVGFATWHGP